MFEGKETTRLELLKIAKPIPFNAEMAREIKRDNKFVTRRKVKPQPPKEANGVYERMDNGNFQLKLAPYETIYDYEIKPPYETGDYLYVQEPWATKKSNACIAIESGNCPHKSCDTADGPCFADEYIYKADDLLCECVKWRSLIHIPKEAVRIFLRVTDVRVERLQDIEISDLQMEGFLNSGYVSQYAAMTTTAFEDFKKVWNSTVKKSDLDRYGWNANPWVWVIEFERVRLR